MSIKHLHTGPLGLTTTVSKKVAIVLSLRSCFHNEEFSWGLNIAPILHFKFLHIDVITLFSPPRSQNISNPQSK